MTCFSELEDRIASDDGVDLRKPHAFIVLC